MRNLNSEILLNMGFEDVGKWVLNGEYISYALDIPTFALLDTVNALYAFVCDGEVKYIGKTARSIRRRFFGYCRPGITQQTNKRCHAKIKKALAEGAEIRVLIFAPQHDLRYSEFEINLAAGLEDSLIDKFDPPWNGGDRGRRITENAEREAEEEKVSSGADTAGVIGDTSIPRITTESSASFNIKLGQTYYEFGFINPGVEASRHLGNHGDPVRILFDDGCDPIISTINRTANRSGGVRIVGNNRHIAQWFQEHFNLGDTIQGCVIDAHTILFDGHSANR